MNEVDKWMMWKNKAMKEQTNETKDIFKCHFQLNHWQIYVIEYKKYNFLSMSRKIMMRKVIFLSLYDFNISLHYVNRFDAYEKDIKFLN